MAPYQPGNAAWKDDASVEVQVGTNGSQAQQDGTPTSHTKTDSNTNLPHMMDMAMRNVKLTPSKGELALNWTGMLWSKRTPGYQLLKSGARTEKFSSLITVV